MRDAVVFKNDKNDDASLLKLVNQKLSRGGGGSQSRITATVQRGTVTLMGKLQYDAQRAPLTKAVASVAGVRRVVDALTVTPRVNHYAAAEARAEAKATNERKEAQNAQAAADAAEGADTVLDDAVEDESVSP
jgi:ABC-type cobalamin/Fe3+-siderophores transport system ATPase subunit